MTAFKENDHFSGHADRYEAYRPNYPEPLFAYLASLASAHELAWDCATGNGQAALALARYFDVVIATDASSQQIDRAHPHERVRYHVASAELAPIDAGAADVVTVAQALHWFDLTKFYAEARRVLKRRGILAVWCYQLHTITPEIDAIVHHYYTDIVGADWPAERRLVEEEYKTLPFPFDEIIPPPLPMVHSWDLERVVGYLDSWSATQRYRKRTGSDPLEHIQAALAAAWGEPGQIREVTWPLHMRVGRN